MTPLLTPAEVAEVTGQTRAAKQAAELAKRGIAYTFTGARVEVVRAVAEAYRLLAQRQNGPDFSRVK